MIPTTLLRAGAFRAAGLLRSRVPDRMCRFKTTHDPEEMWFKETWGLRAHRGTIPKWVPFAKSDFTGRFVVHFLVREIPAEALEQVLKDNELVLDRQPGQKTDPVFLLRGHQQGVRQILWPNGVSMDYLESIIAIPKVRLAGCADGYCGPFNFATRIDANELSPVLLGRIVGYPKHFSWIQSSTIGFNITQLGTSSSILSAQFAPSGDRVRALDMPSAVPALSMLRYPVFSRSLVSPQIFTYFDWQLDEAWAPGQPVTATVVVKKDLAGLPAQTYEWGPGQANALSYRLSIPWQLCGPFPREAITCPIPPFSPKWAG